ncbi:EAL domain-containing protein [Sulfuricurvum sp.]|uniref:EAL domain-containing protein n=1 Tax=Sulfuricurvum sp. TaxID=2025608 RepID=UPI003BB71C66
MWNNITSFDKVIRFTLGSVCVYGGIVYHPLFALPAIALFLSVATNSCAVYKMMGINHKIEEKNHYLSVLPKYNPEPVLIFCDQGNLLFRNDAAHSALSSLHHFSQLDLRQSPAELIASQSETALRYREGERTYQLVLRGNIHDNFVMVYGFDITLIAQGEEALKTLALSDPLTQMANRKKLIIDLEAYPMRMLSLVDIKNFGQINGFYGHEIGDRFLKSFAHMVDQLKEWEDTDIYRVQSDLFAIFSGDERLFEMINDFFIERYIVIDEIEFALEVTMGNAKHSDKERSLLTMAETALMEAKKRGVKSLHYHELGNINQRYLKNLEWSKRIKHILNHEDSAKLTAYFQPILNTSSNKIEKYETLARVVDGDTVTPPIVFLDPAKQLGLLPKITMAMLDAIIHKAHENDTQFSINITMQDIQSEKFSKALVEKLLALQLSPLRIVLEILEDEEVYEYLSVFKELKEYGFKIAIDDFGTGYSNFAKLQQIEVDYIKIDGSLIQTIDTNSQHLEVVRTMNNYAHSIGAKTIAEFVSSDVIAQILIDEKIDYLQGYAIGKPLPSLVV